MSTPGDSLDGATQVSASLTESLRDTLASAWHLAEASLALLRAELRLARSSALALAWLAFALVFFGVGAWLALTVAIAMVIAQLSGQPLIGVAAVALINLAGTAWVLLAMRRCWSDLGLPRTRALIAQPSVRATGAHVGSEVETGHETAA
jgi:hypothetical protein